MNTSEDYIKIIDNILNNDSIEIDPEDKESMLMQKRLLETGWGMSMKIWLIITKYLPKEPQPDKLDEFTANWLNAEISAARLIYIPIMIVGVFFVERWIIWIGATIFYVAFVRKKMREAKENSDRKRRK